MSVWSWLGNIFSNVKKHWAATAVTILEVIKPLFSTGGVIAAIAGSISPNLGPSVVALLNKEIPKLIATGLAIEGLPDNPTEADIQTFENNVLKAFGALNDSSQFKTTLAAQIYGIIHAQLAGGTKLTFAELVGDVQEAYLDYQSDKAAEAANAANANSAEPTT